MSRRRILLAILALAAASAGCGDDSGTGASPPLFVPDASEDADTGTAGDVLRPPEDTEVVDSARPDVSPDIVDEPDVQADAPDERPVLARCTDSPFTPPAAQGFATEQGRAAASLGKAVHSIEDPIVPSDDSWVELQGRFAYSYLFSDLKGEPVRIYMDRCNGFELVADEVTSNDGIAMTVVDMPPPGIYGVRMVVMGDASVAKGNIFVLPRGTRIVVFDIDGTLTVGDTELFADIVADFFEPMLDDDAYVPVAYTGAQRLTLEHERRNAILLYLTGRPYWLHDKSRQWLEQGGFALGAVHTTDNNLQVVPNDDRVGTYKREFLDLLRSRSFAFDAAYGNATTDIYGYLGTGIPASDVWIIGEHGGEQGTNPVVDSWEPHAIEVSNSEPIQQPFRTAP